MASEFYREALKKGQKEKRICINEGKNPYLPALDTIVSSDKMLTEVYAGLMQVPTEWVVGTKTASRANAFARNFMPLLAPETEFGMKWGDLCESHMEEGIHDSVKVYEYKNRYYVQEGNKRVSVLKFVDAVSILADVYRILPVKDGSKEVEIYYEMLDFYECSKVNYLEFSELGCFKQIQKLMGKAPNEAWNEDDRSHFKTAFYNLKKAFHELNGESVHVTASDAMLTYLRIFGFADLISKSNEQIKKSLLKIWEEVCLLEENEHIDLKEVPEENWDNRRQKFIWSGLVLME